MKAPETGFDAGAIADALFLWRQARGESQEEVADASGVPQPTISKMELGDSLTIQNLGRLLAFYGKTMVDLYEKVRDVQGWPPEARQIGRRARNLPVSPRPRTPGRAARRNADKKDHQPRGSRA